MAQDLHHEFHEHFEILTGASESLAGMAQALRYQVYCLETGFENAADFPDGRERDLFDDHSVHGLIRFRETGEPLATVRLVLPDAADPARPLPLELHCREAAARASVMLEGWSRQGLAEISRFAVSKQAMHRLKERGQSRQLMLQVTLGLFHAVLRLAAEQGVHHLYAVMEPSLLRLLSRFGIVFHALGGVVPYHGWRQPCLGVAEEMLDGIYRQRRDLWYFITEGGELWNTQLEHPAAA